MTTREPRLVLLISGRGSNMEAFIRAIEGETLQATISAVISNEPDAAGLYIAEQAGIQTRVVPHREYSNREAFDAALAKEVRPTTLIW